MTAFQSPFIGKSVEDIHSIFVDRIRGDGEAALPDFAYFTFTILDEQTAKDKSTCLVVCTAPDDDEDDDEDEEEDDEDDEDEEDKDKDKPTYRYVRTEFANSLYHAVQLDHQRETVSEIKDLNDGADLIRWEDEEGAGDVDQGDWQRLQVNGT